MSHVSSGWVKGVRGAALAVSLCVLAACSTTGESFRSSGLDRIVEGRTTFQQAVQDLGTEPVDTWQQGDTLLARWAYKGTVATDAVYFRQEVWLRFGPDGRFLRTERSINVPALFHTRTAAEADREAAERARRRAPSTRTAAAIGDPAQGGMAPQSSQSQAVPVTPPPAIEPETAGNGSAPLLPAGTQVIPGATYPLGGVSQ